MQAKPSHKISQAQKSSTTRAKQYTQFNNKFNSSNVTFFSVMFTSRLTFVCYIIPGVPKSSGEQRRLK